MTGGVPQPEFVEPYEGIGFAYSKESNAAVSWIAVMIGGCVLRRLRCFPSESLRF